MSKRGGRQAYRQTRADATERYVDGRDTLRERRSEKDGERERESAGQRRHMGVRW